MMKPVFLILFLLGAIPVWSQVQPSASGGGDDERMQMPGPVSGEAYPMTGTDQERSNFLSAGIGFIAGYNDNVYAGGNAAATSEGTFSVLPSIAVDETTPRRHESLSYNSGFIFYEPTSALNSVQQSGNATFLYRMSVRTRLTISDSFQQSSNPFNQASLPGEPISGSPQNSTANVINPFADQISNTGNVGLNYQYAKNGMIGLSGSTYLLNFPNPAQAAGLNNSISGTGSAFLSRRLTSSQYLGAIYNYSDFMTHPVDSTTQTQTISMFYTLFLSRTFSISATGGPQHYASTYLGVANSSAWTPSYSASMSLQRRHGSISGQFSRTVTGGGGLLGTYYSSGGSASEGWQFARTWNASASAGYFVTSNATPIQFSANLGGHSLMGMISLTHQLGQRLNTQFAYLRSSYSYNGIAAVSSTPGMDRVTFTISYYFSRPLGR